MSSAGLRTLRRLGVVTDSLPMATSLKRGALFYGDIPVVHRSRAIGALDLAEASAGSDPVNFVCAEDYDEPRPTHTMHRNLTYTPSGYAWVNRRLDVALSAKAPGSARALLIDRLLVDGTVGDGNIVEEATIIQSQYPFTYGDWTSEQMKSIALCPDFPRPLLLPADIGNRAYVKSELVQLGIDYVSVERPMLIRRATVLHKTRPITLWDKSDVRAYRKLFNIQPPPARPGSILYLSRAGVRSEQRIAERRFPSEMIAGIVASLGGKVVVTNGMARQDFSELASDAETVIADHGAALFNILQWNTRNLVEIVTDSWWSRCFVFLGTSCGVANHAVVRCDGRDRAELQAILQRHLTHFQARPSASS
jgi:hypothetical protein